LAIVNQYRTARAALPLRDPLGPGWLAQAASTSVGERLGIGALQQTSLQPGQVWPLGLRIAPEATGGTLVVKGLVAGAKLSVGRPSDTNGSELKADEIDGAVILPPPGFAGSMDRKRSSSPTLPAPG